MVEKKNQICQQCGQCCSQCAGTIFACSDDIIRWIQTDRFDILKHFKYVDAHKYVWGDKLWSEYHSLPVNILQKEIVSCADLLTPSHNEYKVCPFRKKQKDGKYKCSIHATKPDVCKEFTPWESGWAIDCDGNSHDVSPEFYTWCEAMKLMRSGD